MNSREQAEWDELVRKAREDLIFNSPGELVTSPFVEYATMYKAESRLSSAMLVDETPRQLECVSCGMLMLWTTYRLDPSTFDRRCKDCKVRARDFYKTRPSREVNDAKERDNGGIPEADLPGSG